MSLTLRLGTTYTSYVTGTQTTTLLSSYPITQTQTQIQTFTSSYAITTTAPGKSHKPSPSSFLDCPSDAPIRANEIWSSMRCRLSRNFFSASKERLILTFSSLHNFEYNHCNDHTPGKHSLHYKYIVGNNYHAHFIPTACDHDLHFNHFACPTDNNFGCWNNYDNYGRSYSHTGRCHSDADPGLDSAWNHSPGFDNSYYDYPRSQHNNFDIHITERDDHRFGFDDYSIGYDRHNRAGFHNFDNNHTRRQHSYFDKHDPRDIHTSGLHNFDHIHARRQHSGAHKHNS